MTQKFFTPRHGRAGQLQGRDASLWAVKGLFADILKVFITCVHQNTCVRMSIVVLFIVINIYIELYIFSLFLGF